MNKRKLIKKWKLEIENITDEYFVKTKENFEKSIPKSIASITVITSTGDVKNRELRDAFESYLIRKNICYTLGPATSVRYIPRSTVKEYLKFRDMLITEDVNIIKEKYWNDITLNIERSTGITVHYNKDDNMNEIKKSIVYCLEKELIWKVDWNRVLALGSMFASLASSAVSIILALKS